jgi:hypothetical protein
MDRKKQHGIWIGGTTLSIFKKKAVEENSDKRENDAAQESTIALLQSCSTYSPHQTHSQQTILTAGRNRSRPHPWVRPKVGHAGREAEVREEESRESLMDGQGRCRPAGGGM